MRSITPLCAVFLLLGVGDRASAQPVTFEFDATVSVFDALGVLGGVSGPLSVTGSYTFDPATPDSNADPDSGTYISTAAGSGLQASFDAFSIATDPASPFLRITTSDEPDIYSVRSLSIQGTGGFPPGWVFQVLIDVTAPAPSSLLTSDELPSTPPDLALGNSVFFEIVGGPDIGNLGALNLIGTLDRLERVSEQVAIDIKPGSSANPIYVQGRGVIPVAILGSESFDVTNVDVTTLLFEDAAPFHASGGHLKDVNGDSFTDLVSHYLMSETGIESGQDEACVTGELLDGTPFEGCDAIVTVGPCGLGFELALLLPGLMWLRQRRNPGSPRSSVE